MSSFPLQVRTPEKLVFSGNVTSVKMQARDGGIQVLPGHADLATVLSPGSISYKLESGEEATLKSSEGFAMVKDKSLFVLQSGL